MASLRVGRLVLLACAALLALPLPAAAVVISAYAETGAEPVVTGVDHGWGTAQTDTATQNVNVLRVAHSAPDVSFELGLPFDQVNARRRTSKQAIDYTAPGHRVVAAVNGDFWQTSSLGVVSPVGLNVLNGELISGGTAERGAFGVRSDGSPIIGTPHLVTTVTLPTGEALTADAVNKIRAEGDLIVFTPRFGPSTGTDASGIEVRVTGTSLPITPAGTYSGTVASAPSSGGNTALGSGDIVLSATGSAAEALAALEPMDQVTITTAIDASWTDVVTAVGGISLISNGLTIEATAEKYTIPNPRTALGITADADIVVVTVDGRTETSGGMPLGDLAEVMHAFGAVDALNLDGGGSTTMVVDAQGDSPLRVVNGGSDGYERTVNTTLQIVSSVEEPLTVQPPRPSIVSDVRAGKTDAAVRLHWSMTGDVARVRLQVQRNAGQWRDVTIPRGSVTVVTQRFTYGSRYRYRVRAWDTHGDMTAWATSPVYVLARYNEKDPRVDRDGAWLIKYRASAIGKHIAKTAASGQQTLLLPFTGIEVAVVAEKSASGGSVVVSVGDRLAVMDLRDATTSPRTVVAVLSASDSDEVIPTTATLEVTSVAGAARGSVAVDAFLVLEQR